MTDTEVIQDLRARLGVPVGRHLYGVLGSYRALQRFATNLQQASSLDGLPFLPPVSVNHAILEAIPDEQFKELAAREADRPLYTIEHVRRAFESFLRARMGQQPLLALWQFELLFAYNLELHLLRTLATDDTRILLLLPGNREQSRIALYPQDQSATRILPTNLIADNHLWQLED